MIAGPSDQGAEKYAILRAAINEGDEERVREIIGDGQEWQSPSDREFFRVALQTAALNGNLSLCEFLINHGAPLDVKDHHDPDRNSPNLPKLLLHLASENGYESLVRLLLGRGVSTEPVN